MRTALYCLLPKQRYKNENIACIPLEWEVDHRLCGLNVCYEFKCTVCYVAESSSIVFILSCLHHNLIDVVTV